MGMALDAHPAATAEEGASFPERVKGPSVESVFASRKGLTIFL
jgi:hypothetical protein